MTKSHEAAPASKAIKALQTVKTKPATKGSAPRTAKLKPVVEVTATDVVASEPPAPSAKDSRKEKARRDWMGPCAENNFVPGCLWAWREERRKVSAALAGPAEPKSKAKGKGQVVKHPVWTNSADEMKRRCSYCGRPVAGAASEIQPYPSRSGRAMAMFVCEDCQKKAKKPGVKTKS